MKSPRTPTVKGLKIQCGVVLIPLGDTPVTPVSWYWGTAETSGPHQKIFQCLAGIFLTAKFGGFLVWFVLDFNRKNDISSNVKSFALLTFLFL